MFSGLSKSEQPATVLLAAASSPAHLQGQGSTGMGAGSAEHWAKRVGLLACFCCAQPSISNLVCRRKGVHGAFMMHEVVAEEHICSHTSNSHLRTLVACLLGEATALSRLFCRNSLLLALDPTKPKEIPQTNCGHSVLQTQLLPSEQQWAAWLGASFKIPIGSVLTTA